MNDGPTCEYVTKAEYDRQHRQFCVEREGHRETVKALAGALIQIESLTQDLANALSERNELRVGVDLSIRNTQARCAILATMCDRLVQHCGTPEQRLAVRTPDAFQSDLDTLTRQAVALIQTQLAMLEVANGALRVACEYSPPGDTVSPVAAAACGAAFRIGALQGMWERNPTTAAKEGS